MQLKISVPRATPDELNRGLEAAVAVFRTAKVHPVEAAGGAAARKAWDISGFQDDIDGEDLKAAGVWDEAESAALDAVCAGWDKSRERPGSANLSIVTDPETQLVDRSTALEMLRSRVKAENGKGEFLDTKVADLGWVIAENLEDQFLARSCLASSPLHFGRWRWLGFIRINRWSRSARQFLTRSTPWRRRPRPRIRLGPCAAGASNGTRYHACAVALRDTFPGRKSTGSTG